MPQHAPTLNSTNSNWYETEQSHLNYHADAEPLFDTTNIHPQNHKTIMSISLGATRDFLIKHNRTKQVFRIPLRNGDVLIMYRDTQTHYKHALPPPHHHHPPVKNRLEKFEMAPHPGQNGRF
jgi:alkylated DNA repair dioxygenase AlkB